MEEITTVAFQDDVLSYDAFKHQVLNDYKLAVISREASLLGRREVLTGKAKFGIFGDGKELAQIAMAKSFQPGDIRSGYYRDQTFMFATGLASVQQFFAQLYADANSVNDPHSSGRQMVNHFSTRNTDANGKWLDLANRKNTFSDISPTAGQMPRSIGLSFASKLFRESTALQSFHQLSHNGNEVCFCTIGDASTSEGYFWETVNAAAVLQIPLAIFVWDDGYGISVPKEQQTAKGSISEALAGMQKQKGTNGINIYKVKGWDYAGMCETFEAGIAKCRENQVPCLFHVEEVTQPQGHSTSGSHERYKSTERLQWEKDWDCLIKFKEWIIGNEIATAKELEDIALAAKEEVKQARSGAWKNFIEPIQQQVKETVQLIRALNTTDADTFIQIQSIADELEKIKEPLRKDAMQAICRAMELGRMSDNVQSLKQYYRAALKEMNNMYGSHLYNQTVKSALKVTEVKPLVPFDAPMHNAYEIINKYFDKLFENNPLVVAFGEDVGNIGDVNQGFAGLQKKYGDLRIFDTGIREATIMGQAAGLAFRGLRPIAEIQYLDYLMYGLQVLTDDVATLHYRTKGLQSCPLVVRTRGHRLEGIWHSGSPMGMMINALNGMYICVPRNIVQAIGMYNTLLQGNDPAIVVECLNGYRLKEKMPANLLEITVPLGLPDIVKYGEDVTIVTYGSTVRVVLEAAERLQQLNISCEVIDVQTLLPFDINHIILQSLKKTSRIIFIDEDVPGGATSYMYNKVMEEQGGYKWIDAAPRTLTAKAHRPAYGTDGDYFSKPNAEDVISAVYDLMAE